jgi:hypothetical protein
VFGRTGSGFDGDQEGTGPEDRGCARRADRALGCFTIRSARDCNGDLGVAPHIVEALINHTSGHRSGVAGVHNRALYTVPKTQAMAAWADRLMAIVENRELAGNIAPIRLLA